MIPDHCIYILNIKYSITKHDPGGIQGGFPLLGVDNAGLIPACIDPALMPDVLTNTGKNGKKVYGGFIPPGKVVKVIYEG